MAEGHNSRSGPPYGQGVPVAVVLALSVGATPAWAAATERVSLGPKGAQANGDSFAPSVSADGRFVAFESLASNLVPGDDNGVSDVFVHDRQTGATALVSAGKGGVPANGASTEPSVSADGRYVAFTSEATNLAPGATNLFRRVYVRDLEAGTTRLVSAGRGGAAADGDSFLPRISATGRFVSFTSQVTTLVPDDTNGAPDVFVRDLEAGTTRLVSVGLAGEPANGASFLSSISATGRFVAFGSGASNLVARDTNLKDDVFVRDLTARTTVRVSVGPAARQGSRDSFLPSISANGRLVAFASQAPNLVAGDTNRSIDVFVRDRSKGETRRVSVAESGAQANGRSYYPSISADGHVVAFQSKATNLVPEDSIGQDDVFVRDLEAGTTTLVSIGRGGAPATRLSQSASVSRDGSLVAFASGATNLVSGDTNRAFDVFVRTR